MWQRSLFLQFCNPRRPLIPAPWEARARREIHSILQFDGKVPEHASPVSRFSLVDASFQFSYSDYSFGWLLTALDLAFTTWLPGCTAPGNHAAITSAFSMSDLPNLLAPVGTNPRLLLHSISLDRKVKYAEGCNSTCQYPGFISQSQDVALLG